MNIEDQLRDSLRRRAATVPDAAVTRVMVMDYGPRTRRRITRPLAAGVAAIATVGATVGAAIALLGSAAPAFAGWSPTPTTPTAGQLGAATAKCRGDILDAALPLQLHDTRGPYTFEMFANARTLDTCLVGPSVLQTTDVTSVTPFSAPAGQLALTGDHETDTRNGSYSIAQGRAGAGVTAATITLSDGSTVEATVANGWFVAWWPNANTVQSASVSTTSGTHTQTFVAPGRTCSPKLCSSQGTTTNAS